ncbi:TetR/AcrR family transcriptional regulator [Saccharopolyspora terrae]|uniref:TetR/AcrR family transcriptional regulator n=1 Tax=Saccharopolyspora terrae TaxID=2530384 RepID=UPI001A9EE1D7|nr:TetR/AcrR family transcriptional regulator [Saccharopolyspora terrae]
MIANSTPEGSAPRRRSARGEAARERILHAAVEAFAQDGYQGCSLARIASEVGLSQAGLLHHFPTKEDLLAAVLDERDRLDTRRFLADGAEGIDVLAALEKLVEYNTYLTGMVQSFTVLAGESTADLHPARDWFQNRYDNVREMIAAELRTGVERGEIRADTDCEGIAAELVATIDGLQLQWLLAPKKIDMPALFRQYTSRLRNAIST